MLNLNLLPPSKIKALSYRLRTRAVASVGFAASTVLFIAVALLLPTIIFLGFEKSTSLDALQLEKQNEEHAGIKASLIDIQLVNKQADFIVRHASSTPSLASKVEDITRIMPVGVSVDSISYTAKTRQFSISGTSVTRDLFLTFKNALEHDGAIAKVTSPVSNVIQGTNIKFSVTANLR